MLYGGGGVSRTARRSPLRSFQPHAARHRAPPGSPAARAADFSRRYRALSRSIDKDGFKAALLLRLAPVLPIPIDAHWYVAGCTPLKLPTFFCAYFVGALKATFLDAYLGSLLTSGLAGEEAVSGGTRMIVIAETVCQIIYIYIYI